MSRLYAIPVAKDASGKREPRKLTTENYNVTAFDWSPDGARLVFSHTKSPVANDWTTSDVSIVEVSTAKAAPFAATPAAESSPVFSPDGKSIAMLVSDNPPRWAQSGLLQIYSVSGGGQPKSLSAECCGLVCGWQTDLFFRSQRHWNSDLRD
jgi:Tol biopolymer transport system component